jgi:hypothetical protein
VIVRAGECATLPRLKVAECHITGLLSVLSRNNPPGIRRSSHHDRTS